MKPDPKAKSTDFYKEKDAFDIPDWRVTKATSEAEVREELKKHNRDLGEREITFSVHEEHKMLVIFVPNN